MRACGKQYDVIRLLGHGKGGYSYLVEREGKQYVLKQIHHEPCDYYEFSDKIGGERDAYKRLVELGIRIPKMYEIDMQKERIIKQYIEGETIFDIVMRCGTAEAYLPQIRKIARHAEAAGVNIDYFPRNFVVNNGLLYYVDYEANEYSDKWNFENWGIQYWSKTPAFLQHLKDCGLDKEGKAVCTAEGPCSDHDGAR